MAGTSPGRLATNALPIVFAIILWIVALETRTFQVVEQVSVILPVLPDSLAVFASNGSPLDSISITFSGRGASVLFDQLSGRPVSITLSQPEMAGLQFPVEIPVDPDPAGITWVGRRFSDLQVVSFEPGLITIPVDRVVSRRVAVSVATTGRIPSRFLWMSVSPAWVTITGPETLVEKVDSVDTVVLVADQPGTAVRIETGSPMIESEPVEVEARLVRPVPVISFVDL